MNSELQEYLTTGMLGAYHPESAILRENELGGVDTIFRDTSCWKKEGHLIREREMLIGEKHFFITSVFPNQPIATPTDKLLALIDTDVPFPIHQTAKASKKQNKTQDNSKILAQAAWEAESDLAKASGATHPIEECGRMGL